MTDLRPDAFADLACDGPHLPLQQHAIFGAAMSLMGRLPETVELRAGDLRVGSAQVIWRDMGPLGMQGAIVRGPMFEAGTTWEQAEALRALAPQGLRMIEAEGPTPALARAGYVQVATPAHVAELPIDGDKADRRARAHPKWRASLARAEAAGLTLRTQPFRGQPGHWLLAREAEARKAKGYRGLPPMLPLALGQADPRACRLFWAEKGGEPVAGMLFVRHGVVATYLTGWSGEAGRAACAHHLLLMTAADWMAARGLARLDLGQVDTEAAAGLARFKIGSGARVRPLGGSWLRLPFCGHPTGKSRTKRLHPLDIAPCLRAAHDQNDPRTLRTSRVADDRTAADHRPGA